MSVICFLDNADFLRLSSNENVVSSPSYRLFKLRIR